MGITKVGHGAELGQTLCCISVQHESAFVLAFLATGQEL